MLFIPEFRRFVAHALDALGLPQGSAIAIDMPMNVDSVIIYLAIVLTGNVVVSIADSFAPSEIATRLRIANAKAIFTQVFLSPCYVARENFQFQPSMDDASHFPP